MEERGRGTCSGIRFDAGEILPRNKVFLCGKLGKPASLQAIFSIFYGSEENTKTEDFFGRGGGGGW